MTKDEALKLAMEALEKQVSMAGGWQSPAEAKAITAIKEALAQPEQEPVAWRYKILDYFGRPVWTFKTPKTDIRVLESQPLYTTLPQRKPEQEPVAWKLVPTEPTNEMLKAMDECSTEGYDERLLAGHASSVYMAAVDVAPTPPQRKPLSDEEIILIVADCASSHQHTDIHFARAIEAAHGIKGEA